MDEKLDIDSLLKDATVPLKKKKKEYVSYSLFSPGMPGVSRKC